RADTVGARDVTGSSNYAALAAADDDRLVGNRRIVAFLNGRVKGVAIDMRNRQPVEIRMTSQPGRAAGVAAGCYWCAIGQAVATEAHALSRSHTPPPRAAMALPISVGSIRASAAKSVRSLSSALRYSSTPAKKPGS